MKFSHRITAFIIVLIMLLSGVAQASPLKRATPKNCFSLKAGTGRVTISIKKIKKAKFIQFKCGADKKFKKSFKKKVANKKHKYIIKSLKGGKTYYFKVRFKAKNGVYSTWSKVKKVKVKSNSIENTTKKIVNNEVKSEYIKVGQGSNQFYFEAEDKNGAKINYYNVSTDEKIVGDALKKLKLIDGENSEYGLYVKKVCGVEADYDKTKTYWAFYVDGQYATKGVDSTEIEKGKVYKFKIE